MAKASSIYHRKQRLIRDSLEPYFHDVDGQRTAMTTRAHYNITLDGLSLRGVRATFRATANLFDPPRQGEHFTPEDIARHESFRILRNMMNENGVDIETYMGHYHLTVSNIYHDHGQHRPVLHMRLVPWDGIKRKLEPYNQAKHGPKRTPFLPFY